MYSFEGEYRRKPQQSLSGSSALVTRKELLTHAKKQRQEREQQRLRSKSSVSIQAYVRSYFVRKREKARVRLDFDKLLDKLCKTKTSNLDEIGLALRMLLFFYWDEEDRLRLVELSRIVLREHPRLLPLTVQTSWNWLICRLLALELTWLATSPESGAVPLRLLEVFTSLDLTTREMGREAASNLVCRIFAHLIPRGYLATTRAILEARTPPLLVASPRPPTPLAGSLLQLLMRPLELRPVLPPHDFKVILQRLCYEVLSPRPSEVMRLFLIPALGDLTTFPFREFVAAVRDLPVEAHTPGLMLTFLQLEKRHFAPSGRKELQELIYFLEALASLTLNFRHLTPTHSDSDDEDEVLDTFKDDRLDLEECLALLNDEGRVTTLLSAIEETNELLVVNALSLVCHNLLLSSIQAVHKCRLLYMLAFKPAFLRQLWSVVAGVSQTSVFGTSTPLIQLISRGVPLTPDESPRILPPLAVFCSLFTLLLATLHETDFYGDESGIPHETMPFSLEELVGMSRLLKDVSLGLVDLAYPDSRPVFRDIHGIETTLVSRNETQVLSHLFKMVVRLVRQLHARDNHRSFCPEGHWVSKQVQLILGLCQPSELAARRRRLRGYRPFQGLRAFTREELELEGPPLTMKEVRTATLLHELPFLVPFQERVMVFQTIVMKDKMEHQGDVISFLRGAAIQISVRRNYLYEDAFDKLSLENEPELRLKMRVQLVNQAGLGEAGVDGGGLFREFLTELLKTAFDPNRGFFKLTTDNLLYPNPNVHLIVPHFTDHYFFIGRILGKALYENLLVELPLAEFFLQKLVSKHADVDIHHLASLDPVMYRNLLFLKNYDGDVQDLGLDFTILTEELGERRVEELKPGGASTTVTSSNRIEYVHLVADYKLNRQIRSQCAAFRAGLTRVVPLEWIQMFNSKELQVLIAGAEVPVDVDDLRDHTNYAGGYNEIHPTIIMFWNVVTKFSDLERRLLLKFVTSCSRPPLLGFKELDPPFCVQHAGSSDRLPTASTCMNLLKLPEFPDENLMAEKLAYAIQAGAGFELS